MDMKDFNVSKEDIQTLEIAYQTAELLQEKKRIKVILLRAAKQKISVIVKETGLHESSVQRILSAYRERGVQAVIGNNYKGMRNRTNMTFEQEEDFLERFQKDYDEGRPVYVRDIKAAYERRLGHTVGGTQIYLVLYRHGWTKDMFCRTNTKGRKVDSDGYPFK